ncbi:MAG TPA: carboxyltransferase domain-containing protein [Acidimicrobiales bacterium]
MTPSIPLGEVRPFGDRALLIGVADPARGRALARGVRAMPGLEATVETVVGLATVLVALSDPDLSLGIVQAGVEAALLALTAGASASTPVAGGEDEGTTHTIPCMFDGPDLDAVATRAGCGAEEVVALLTGATLTVSVMGFSPGFAYLDGLPPELATIPRRDSPRPEVPPGSVALANGHAAVYPTASPGGWQLVGRTAYRLFSTGEPPYAALAPGDRVRFTVADDAAGQTEVRAVAPAGAEWAPPEGARAVLEVVVPGLRAALQDGGRRGVAAIGVPGAQPADPVSFLLANRLAGNRDDASALEITAGVTRVRCLQECHVAVVGGEAEVAVDGRMAGPGRVVALDTGQLLQIGPLRVGLRAYLSVAGGFLGPVAFGSTASDQLSGLGPGPLAAGQRLHAGPWSTPLGDHLAEGAAPRVGPGRPVPLRVLAGPQHERFPPDVVKRLAELTFVVDDRSNRVGLRLRPKDAAPGPAWWGTAEGELDSQGVVTGAVQVPPGGDPIVLGPDHATLGGYPVVAVVISADHGLLGQCAPGTEVRFVPVDASEAEESAGALRRVVERAVIGHFPLAVD